MEKVNPDSFPQRTLQNRFYPTYKGYDKSVYENTWGSLMKILGVFVLFYAAIFTMLWGLFEYGLVHSRGYTALGVIVFGVTFLGLMVLITSGHFANKKKHFAEFLKVRISDKKAKKEEEINRQKQEAEYQRKLAERNLAASQSNRN